MQLKATVKAAQAIAMLGACALVLGGCALGVDAARLAAGSREPASSTTDGSTVASAPADAAAVDAVAADSVPADSVPADSGSSDTGLAEAGSGPAGGSYLPPLGTYDPATSSLPPFDPCTEIPAEAFAEIGFPEEYVATNGAKQLPNTCAYTGSSPDVISIMLFVSSVTYSQQTLHQLAQFKETEFLLDSGARIIGFQDPSFQGTNCEFVISTQRGNVSFLYDRNFMDKNGNLACTEGFESIRKLIN